VKGAGLLRALGRIAGLVLIVACFTFRADFHKSDVETRDEWSVGVWFSPWLVSSTTSRSASDTERTSSLSTSTHVTATSWSWVLLAAGMWLVFKCRKRKTAPAPAPTASPPAQPPV
jgi:hypothetical protein